MRLNVRAFFLRHRIEVLIFSAIVLIRLVALGWLAYRTSDWKYPLPVIEIDAREYQQIAVNLIEHHAFSLKTEAPFQPDSFRTPIYPFLLAALLWCFGSIYAIAVFQAFCAGVIGVLTYILACRFLNQPAVGVIAAGIFAIEPAGILYSNLAMTETIFLLLLAGGLYYFFSAREQRWPQWVTAGALFGAAALIRPIGIFLPLAVLIPFCILRRRALRNYCVQIGIFLMAFALILAPWLIRNRIVFHSWSISSVSSFNLYYYNAMRFYAFKTGTDLETAKSVFDRRLLDRYPQASTEYSLENAPYFRAAAQEYIASDIWGYMRFHIGTLVPFFLTDGWREAAQAVRLLPRTFTDWRGLFLSGNWSGLWQAIRSSGIESAIFAIGFGLWGMVALGMIFSIGWMIRMRTSDVGEAIAIILSCIALLALLSGVVTTVRFRYAISPLMFLMGIGGWHYFISWYKRYRAHGAE